VEKEGILEAQLSREYPKAVVYSLMAVGAVGFAMATVIGGWQLFVLAASALLGAFALLRFGSALWIALVALLAFSLELPLPGVGAEVVVPTELLIPALVGASLLDLLVRKKFTWTHSRLNIPVLLFVVAVVLTIIPSSNRMVTIKAIVRDGSYVIAGYLLIRHYLTSVSSLKILLACRLLVTVLLVSFGLYTQVTLGFRIYQTIAEPFYKQYSVYAALVAMDFAMLCAFVLEYPRSRLRWMGFAVLGLLGFAIAVTFSRGAWLSLVAMAAFYAFQERRHIDLKIALAVVMVVILGVAIVGSMQVSHLFTERVEHLTDMRFLTNYDRIDRWMAALGIYWDHPLLGVGWGRYADEYYDYIYYINAYSTNIRMGAHNLYLEIMAESGSLGLITFIVLIGFFFIETFSLRCRCKDKFLRATLAGTMGAMITFLVHAFVNNLGPSDKISLSVWVLIGLVPVVGHLMEKSKREIRISKSEANKNSPNSHV